MTKSIDYVNLRLQEGEVAGVLPPVLYDITVVYARRAETIKTI